MANPQYTAGETLAQGNACYIGSNGRMYKALSSDSTKMPVIAIAAESLATAVTGEFYPYGKITWGTWTEPNKSLYISGTTAGLITETAPTAYATHQALGITLSTSVFMFWDSSAYSSVAKSLIWKDSSIVARRRGINLITGSNMTITTSDNSTYDRVDITLASSGSGGSGLSSYYDVVTSYGADPTGVADSTTNIQNALNAANVNGGGVVFFPKGTYKTTDDIFVYSNTTVLGVGRNLSIIKNYSFTKMCLRAYYSGSSLAQGSSYITIRDMGFTSPAGEYTASEGFFFLWASHILVENCRFTNFYNYGVRSTELATADQIHCQYVVIRNCEFQDIKGIATCWMGCYHGIVEGNQFYNIGTNDHHHSFYDSGSSSHIKFINNTCDKAQGIQTYTNQTDWHVPGIIIAGNTFIDPLYAAAPVQPMYARNAVIANNSIYFTNASGCPFAIRLWSSDNNNVAITGNTIYCATKDSGAEGYIAVRGNRIAVTGNVIYGSGSAANSIGIVVDPNIYSGGAENIMITGNMIHNCGRGIWLYEQAGMTTSNIDITGNKIYGSGTTGTYGVDIASGVTYVDIRNNSFRNLTSGVKADAGSTDILVQDNTFKTVTRTCGYPVWTADTVIAIAEFRESTVANSYYYECTARAGDYKTHATTEPTWPTVVGNTVVDDQVTWTCRAKPTRLTEVNSFVFN